MLLAMIGLLVVLHLIEIRSMFSTTARTYSEIMTTALFSQAKKQGEGLGRFVAAILADSIYRVDIDLIRDITEAVRRQESVRYIAVYDANNAYLGGNPVGADKMGSNLDAPLIQDIVSSGHVASFSSGNTLNVVAPVMIGRTLVGCVKIGISLVDIVSDIAAIRVTLSDIIATNQRHFITVYMAVAAITVLLALALSLLMVRGLVQPIQALGRYTRRIGAGNYDDPPPIDRSDELGDLARALGQMAKDFKQVAQVARLATLGEMAVGMAHELSQPLNTIRLAAENTLVAMEQGKSDAEMEMAKFSLISHQAESMGDLIKRMCVVGRSEGPKGIIDPCESVRDAYSRLVGQFADEGIAITLDAPDQCVNVLGRRNELAQVIINFLTNARDGIIESALSRRAQISPTGGRIEITVRNLPEGQEYPAGEVQISVKDNGGGIPPDIIERVFDPFFTTKEVTKGTGLGLSISYGIINAMGGRIKVENFGGGALFTIKLPALKDDEAIA
jgi:signal transduction histidine kinase